MVFHNGHFYSTTLTIHLDPAAFLQHVGLDPYFRRFVRPLGHSNHRHFIDPRHIGNTIHLWTAFVLRGHGYSLPTSPGFRPPHAFATDACRSLRGSVSGRYSFHSTSRIISSEILRFLPLFRLFQTCRGTSRTIVPLIILIELLAHFIQFCVFLRRDRFIEVLSIAGFIGKHSVF